jgi:hypothetical protein
MATRNKKSGGVNINVPSQPVGRLIDVVAGVLSPFAEKGRLRADQIRLQREDVLIEIAKKAKERLAVETTPIKPIPNKILVPLLEAASNEDIDDTYMVDMWARLLASATKESKTEPRYIGILKELRKQQAEALFTLATNQRGSVTDFAGSLLGAPVDCDPIFALHYVDRFLGANFSRDRGKQPLDLREVQSVASEVLNRPGSCIVALLQFYRFEELTAPPYNLTSSQSGLDLEILASMGLCRRVNEHRSGPDAYELYLTYYYITHLGVDFLTCCCPELFDNTEGP